MLHDGGRWVLDYLYPEDKPFLKFGKIEIGNNNFFGARVIVNPGTRIGDNCVIAAGSIVTKDIPSGEVWGGGGVVPAKRLMSIDEYKEKLINNKNIFDLNAFEKNRRNELIRVLMEE
ncbi:DapH/DapD/GlmU-related protein [Enterocloster clostridioformis]|uniref:DapH/DapD/GlmU-related protein n=1 Tax=Enterocloster clostridioformis TaxID=1531 RepID=UPI001A99D7D0|nr:DapH/DapD/GlmU-related protein [Enterocloster clostridioformis]